ncbi:Protein of unknown function [Tenacibaculum sp. MAR_2009_124]|uniref:DUF3575 domain-containing protein n=1 Tax=Tenacibaculum sp. MAR_2009_124 TaxID=1250059 RepID=UPI00089B80A5|nr:DUF3575 domain-containing protein [Tenacibaculum sp. MAR_2009_124]SEB54510.1 Protein of unknown function [Tenacibaculum sp. MAR_2009_124]
MKKILSPALFLLFLISSSIHAQTEVKFNALTTAFLIPNVGVEIQLGERSSVQLDVLASFWDSIDGSPLHITQIFPEYRRYFKPNMRGFFIGGHIGVGMFTLRKYGKIKYSYQSGRNTYFGITVGYKTDISKNWALEFFVGGGSQQAHYRGYDSNGQRVDTQDELATRPFNLSGELIPYRGGIMFVYRIPSRRK